MPASSARRSKSPPPAEGAPRRRTAKGAAAAPAAAEVESLQDDKEARTDAAIASALRRVEACLKPPLLDRLAAVGTLAPLLLCNVPRATRDAALVLAAAQTMFAVSMLPTEGLAELVRQEMAAYATSCGLVPELVHRVASHHSVLSPRTGEFVVPNAEYAKWLAASLWKDDRLSRFTEPLSASVGYAIRTAARPEEALRHLGGLCALLQADRAEHRALVAGLAAVLAALWRQKLHEPAPVERIGQALRPAREGPSALTHGESTALRAYRQVYGEWHRRCAATALNLHGADLDVLMSEGHTARARSALALDRCARFRTTAAAMLAWLPVLDYSLAPSCAAAIGRLSNAKHPRQDELHFYARVLLAVYHLGFSPEVLAALWKLAGGDDDALRNVDEAAHIARRCRAAEAALAAAFEKAGSRRTVFELLAEIQALPGYRALQHRQTTSMEDLEEKHALAAAPPLAFDAGAAVAALQDRSGEHPLGRLEPHRDELAAAAKAGSLPRAIVDALRRAHPGAAADLDDSDRALGWALAHPETRAELQAALGLRGDAMLASTASGHRARRPEAVLTAAWHAAQHAPEKQEAARTKLHTQQRREMDADLLNVWAQTVEDLQHLARHLPGGGGGDADVSLSNHALPDVTPEEAALLLHPHGDARISQALRLLHGYPGLLMHGERADGGGRQAAPPASEAP
jgi:hypothetical protein